MADSEVRQKFEAWSHSEEARALLMAELPLYPSRLLLLAFEAGMRAGEIARWIPVEATPPNYGSISLVRIYESEEFSYTDIATYSYHGGWNVGADGSPKHVKVTHWQPLPAAPEEKK